MTETQVLKNALDQGQGILRLTPHMGAAFVLRAGQTNKTAS